VPNHVEILVPDRLLRDLIESRARSLGLTIGSADAAPATVVRSEAATPVRPGDVEVLIVNFPDAEALDHCSRRSVVGVLLPSSPASLLDLALTLDGRHKGVVLDPTIAARLTARVDRRDTLSGGVALTARESEIIRAMDRGRSMKQISHDLGLAQKTVENHATKLYAKLAATNRREAVRRAHELGIVETEQG
jgi:two-component system, NarL family, nitrate/nitrite response regulator NarL